MNCEAHSRSAMCGSGGALDSGQVFPPDLRPRGIASGWGRRRPLPDALVTREREMPPPPGPPPFATGEGGGKVLAADGTAGGEAVDL